jgi:hypothetical protein
VRVRSSAIIWQYITLLPPRAQTPAVLRAGAAPHEGRLRAPCKPRHVAARKQPRHDGCSRTGKYQGIVERNGAARTLAGAAQDNMNADSSWPIYEKSHGGKCRLKAWLSERNRLRCGQEKIRHNSRSARPCRLLFRFSLDLHYVVPLGMVFMAFLGEKCFAFLFLNGGCVPPSAPLLLMKAPPVSSHYHCMRKNRPFG